MSPNMRTDSKHLTNGETIRKRSITPIDDGVNDIDLRYVQKYLAKLN